MIYYDETWHIHSLCTEESWWFFWVNSNKNFWGFFAENIKIGETLIKKKTKLILQIEKKNIFLPSPLINKLFFFLQTQNLFCERNMKLYKIKCDFENLMLFPDLSKIEILNFYSEDNLFVINLNFLINERKSDFLNGSFLLDIFDSKDNTIKMGFPFFKKYISFFDFEKNKIAFHVFDHKFNRLQSFMNQYRLFQFIFILLLTLLITHFFLLAIKTNLDIRNGLNYMELDIIS